MRTRWIPLGLALAGVMLVAVPVSAANPVTHARESGKKEIHTEYFADDICGPRAGWTTFVVTWHFHVTDLGDSVHVVYGETGRYTTDFDDPATEDYESQFTEAMSSNVTRGGTVTFNLQFHDFPGDIKIHVNVVFVEVDGQVMVERDVLRVDGCP